VVFSRNNQLSEILFFAIVGKAKHNKQQEFLRKIGFKE